jgi:hypothetical protein
MDAPQSSALRPPDASRCAALTGPAQRPGGARLSGSLIDSRPAHSDRALTWILTAGSGPDARAAGGSADRRARHDPARDRPAAWLAPDPRAVHRPGNGGPGIVRALFGVTWHRPVEGDRPLGASHRGRTRWRGRCPSRHRPRPLLHRSCHACGNLAWKPRSAPLCLPLELARLRRGAQHRAGATAASESGRLRGAPRRIRPAKRGFGRQREA